MAGGLDRRISRGCSGPVCSRWTPTGPSNRYCATSPKTRWGFSPRYLAKIDQIRSLEHNLATRFSAAMIPRPGSSSTMNQYPKAE